MKSRVLRLWNRRAPRERALVVVALLATVAVTLDISLLAPLRAARVAAERNAKAARSQVLDLQALVTEQSREGDAQFAERSAALQARRTRAEQVIREAQVDLIAPQDMREQLAAILIRFPQLKVLSVTSTAPTPLGEAVGAGGGAAVASGVYQHGLEVQVEGRYFDLIAYLEALEKAPRRIYWRELDLAVNAQGVPVTRIALFTLSKEAVWMRI
jgi:MSHA biogenesis protein MshJ